MKYENIVKHNTRRALRRNTFLALLKISRTASIKIIIRFRLYIQRAQKMSWKRRALLRFIEIIKGR